jgi:hypothetical protein
MPPATHALLRLPQARLLAALSARTAENRRRAAIAFGAIPAQAKMQIAAFPKGIIGVACRCSSLPTYFLDDACDGARSFAQGTPMYGRIATWNDSDGALGVITMRKDVLRHCKSALRLMVVGRRGNGQPPHIRPLCGKGPPLSSRTCACGLVGQQALFKVQECLQQEWLHVKKFLTKGPTRAMRWSAFTIHFAE